MAGQIIDQLKGYTTALFDVSIRHALRDELSWTHYRFLMRMEIIFLISKNGKYGLQS